MAPSKGQTSVYGLYYKDNLLFIGHTRLPIMSMMKYHRSNVHHMDYSAVHSKRSLYKFMREVGCENIEPRRFELSEDDYRDVPFYVYRQKRLLQPSIPTTV